MRICPGPYVRHDSFICVPWLIRMCDMTHPYVWHDSFVRVTWLIHTSYDWFIRMFDMTHSYVWHDSFICVTWLIGMCDMTHSHVKRLIYNRGHALLSALIVHMCDMTHPYVQHDSSICVTWLIHLCDMTDSYVWHDSFIPEDMRCFLHSSLDVTLQCTATHCNTLQHTATQLTKLRVRWSPDVNEISQ